MVTDGTLGQFRQTVEHCGEARVVVRAVVLKFGVPHTKGSGDVRPIGLLTSLVRVWSRIRKVEVQRWRELNFCDYNFAAKGRSAETAVWRQSVLEEAAATRGKATASELVDLTKAYERCRLELVWLAAIKVKFPLHVLRMELEAYVGTRRLMMKGAVADGIDTFFRSISWGNVRHGRVVFSYARSCRRNFGGAPTGFGIELCYKHYVIH